MTVPSSSAIACSGDGGSGPRAASTRYCIAFLPGIAGLIKPAASIIPSLFVPATGVPAPAKRRPNNPQTEQKPPPARGGVGERPGDRPGKWAGSLAQINIAIDILTVDISRPAETELDRFFSAANAQHIIRQSCQPAAQGRESYLRLSDRRSTRPWPRLSPSEMPERCRRLGNKRRNGSGC